MKNFTFKKHRYEGPYRGFEKDHTDIKLNMKVVGTITERKVNTYIVSFAVEKEPTETDPAPFRWQMINATFKDEDEARQFVRRQFFIIQSILNLHSFED